MFAVWFYACALLLPLAANAALQPNQLGVIINDADPLSVEIGHYYAQRRQIPLNNVLHVRFAYTKSVLDSVTFNRILKQVKTQSSPQVQAYALTWTTPYRVNCMSITAAFALGYAPEAVAQRLPTLITTVPATTR